MTLPRCGVAMAAPLVVACLALLAAMPSARAADIFTVRDVAVDATTESSADARAAALADGKRQAFRQLFMRLVLPEDRPQLPGLANALLDELIEGFEIDDERVSSVRYRATLTVDFKSESVRDLLRGLNIRFAEAISPPALVVPVFSEGGRTVIWGEPADWRNAWLSRSAEDGLVPLVLPLGDVLDISTLSAEQAVALAERDLTALGERYGTKDVVVAYAELTLPPEPVQFAEPHDPMLDESAAVAPGEEVAAGPAENGVAAGALEGARLMLFMRRIGPGGETLLAEEVLDAVPDDTRESLLGRAAATVVARLEDDWKRANILRFDSENMLRAVAPLGGLTEWVDLRRRLIALPVVVGVELAVLSRRAVELRLRYLGDAEQLKRALARADLLLIEAREGWLLQRRIGAADEGQRRAL